MLPYRHALRFLILAAIFAAVPARALEFTPGATPGERAATPTPGAGNTGLTQPVILRIDELPAEITPVAPLLPEQEASRSATAEPSAAVSGQALVAQPAAAANTQKAVEAQTPASTARVAAQQLGGVGKEVAESLAPAARSDSGGETASAAISQASDELVSFRLQIRKPGVYLLETHEGTKDDSVGRKLTASLAAADIGKALAGRDLKTKTLYVTGVAMGSESKALATVHEALAARGIPPAAVNVQVLSIPRPWKEGLVSALKDRVVYFFPSKTRDHQAPLKSEVRSGALSTLILEAPNAFYLFIAMPPIQAVTVLAIHTALLTTYTIWQRYMGNWLMRSVDDKHPAASAVGLFTKQVLLSLPFVLNYSLVAHFAPPSAAHLLFTTVLQTTFYAWVVTRGFRGWASNQKTPQDTEAARSWVNWLLLAPLWLDSIFLTNASIAKSAIFTLHTFAGSIMLTWGHVFIAGLIAAGSLIVFFPSLLDKTLPLYRWLQAKLERLKRKKA